MINQLIANIKKTGAPIVVGLDPMLKYIPEHIQKRRLLSLVRHLRELQRLYGSSIRKLWTRLMI